MAHHGLAHTGLRHRAGHRSRHGRRRSRGRDRRFAQFVIEGRGTPIPTEPTEALVVGGLYRWVRNPMYVSVAFVIGGQALLFWDLGVLVLCIVVLATTWLFVVGYEQPTLRRRYGRSYATYCENVPAWYPRLTPWRG